MTIDIDTSRRASATMPPTARNARGRQALFAALLCVPVVATAADGVAPGRLSAAQIVERNIAARGGLSAWHAVRTLSVTGKLEAGAGDSIARSERVARGSKGQGVRRLHAEVMAVDKSPEAQVLLPFTLEMKQPRMSRLEIQFAGKAAVQVYDGTSGWKLRPFLNRNDVEPFTADESQAEAGKPGLEGPLVDYAAKGTTLALEGLEAVEGHDAYKLKLTLKNGTVQHVWIDANVKETDLTHVKPGDHVDISVDTYSGRSWTGTVDTISPAAGSEFSILPAQNASGNWVKVVQRIPVRIRVDRKPGDPVLRAGMSVIVDIDTGHRRSLSDLF